MGVKSGKYIGHDSFTVGFNVISCQWICNNDTSARYIKVLYMHEVSQVSSMYMHVIMSFLLVRVQLTLVLL